MNRYLTFVLLATILLVAHTSSHAQFLKKYQWDFLTLGVSQAASKTIPTPDGTPEDIGNGKMVMANTTLWYNINRNISVGVNGGILSNFPMFETTHEGIGGTKDIRYNGFSSGLSGKYIFFDKKRIKTFGFGGVTYTIGEAMVPTYIKVYKPADNSFYYIYHNREQKFYNSMGANLGVGATTFFSKGFGMNFILGYQNNGYYKGPYFNLGFFRAFKND
jgi:hypothetical protein